MGFKRIVCIAMIVATLTLVGCHRRDILPPTTTTSADSTTYSGQPTTIDNNVTHRNTTTRPTRVTTTAEDVPLPTINDTSSLEMYAISRDDLPMVVGDDRNAIRINNIGLLNDKIANPLFIHVTNIGEDDIYSATIKATVNGSEISFNISYLPKGGSIWAENSNNYKYGSADKIVIDNNIVIVSASASGVAIDRAFKGILNIYAGEKDGGKGLFVENISGKKIKKVTIKYRPIASGAGLFAAPYQVVITDFENGSKFFKANSYLHDVYVADVQITY